MTRVIVNGSIEAQLRDAKDMVQVCGEAGNILGVFYQTPQGAPVNFKYPPHRVEEIRRRMQVEERTGHPLADILKDLGAT